MIDEFADAMGVSREVMQARVDEGRCIRCGSSLDESGVCPCIVTVEIELAHELGLIDE